MQNERGKAEKYLLKDCTDFAHVILNSRIVFFAI